MEGDDMSLKRDETRDWPGARTIHVGGVDYVVAPLTLRQTIPLADVTKKIFEARETGLTKIDGGERAIYGSDMLDHYVDVIKFGLQRAYPDVTRDDVLDMTGNVDELITASVVIMEQAGGKRDSTPVGEQTAASGSTSSTG